MRLRNRSNFRFKSLSLCLCAALAVISCGSSNELGETSGAQLSRDTFDINAEPLNTPDDMSLAGLWEKTSGSEAIRLNISELSAGVRTIVYAKSCTAQNVTAYSGLEFKVTVPEADGKFKVAENISDSSSNGSGACSTNSNEFEGSTHSISYNAMDKNVLDFDGPVADGLQGFVKLTTETQLTGENRSFTEFDWIPLEKSGYEVGYMWQNKIIRKNSGNSMDITLRKNGEITKNFQVLSLRPRMKCCPARPPQNQTIDYKDSIQTVNSIVFNVNGDPYSWELFTSIKVAGEKFKVKIPVKYEVLPEI